MKFRAEDTNTDMMIVRVLKLYSEQAALATLLISILSMIRPGRLKWLIFNLINLSPGCAVNLQYKRMKNDISEVLSIIFFIFYCL